MFARVLALAAILTAPLAFAAPARADEERGSFGYSLGADPTNWQFASELSFRGHPWGSFSESMFNIVTRSQQLSANKAYALETFGLGLGLGAKLPYVRAGLEGEVAWVKKVEQDPGAAGQLRFVNQPGFILGPYAAVELPFLRSSFTHLDLSLHWPLVKPDDSIGPRVMMTLWLGGGPLVESEEEEEEEGGEEMNEEETSPDEEMEAPAPPPPPAPKQVAPVKPAPKPAPAKPAPKPAPVKPKK